MLTDAREDLCAFATFPRAHWTKIWSTNPIERVNAEIKRRTSVVGIFPNDAAVLRLVTAVCIEKHEEWLVAERRYMSEVHGTPHHRRGSSSPGGDAGDRLMSG